MLRTRSLLALLLFPLSHCGSAAAPPVTQTLWVWDTGRSVDLAPPETPDPVPRFWPAEGEPAPSAAALTGPVVLLDLRGRVAQNRTYQAVADDLDDWQARHGEWPRGAVVLVVTGWSRGWQGAMPELGEEFLEQLCGRSDLRGVGTDLPALTPAGRGALARGGAWLVSGLVLPDLPSLQRARMVVAPFPEVGEGPDRPVRVFLFQPRGSARR